MPCASLRDVGKVNRETDGVVEEQYLVHLRQIVVDKGVRSQFREAAAFG